MKNEQGMAHYFFMHEHSAHAMNKNAHNTGLCNIALKLYKRAII